MGRSVIFPSLLELSSPTSSEAQVHALRSLKNDIVGHDLKKELAVRHGAVKHLAAILKGEAIKGGKRKSDVRNGDGVTMGGTDAMRWDTAEELRFQATLVVGSLANAGPAFITPLLAGGILPPLLEALSPDDTPPKLMVATLRTLNQIADAIPEEKWTDFCSQIYTRPVVDNLNKLIAQPTGFSVVEQEISLAAKFIAKMHPSGEQSKLLLDGGVLDQLAAKLAAMADVDAQMLRGEPHVQSRDELPVQYFPDIVEAIVTIIRTSHYITARFMYSQPMEQVFGGSSKKRTSSTLDHRGLTNSTPWNRLAPQLPTLQSRSEAYYEQRSAYSAFAGDSTFPPLPDSTHSAGRLVVMEDSENPLFTWLMSAARQSEGRGRLVVCWLLALLRKFSEKWPIEGDTTSKTREKYFSSLVVPLVVKMIGDANSVADVIKKDGYASTQLKEESMLMLERCPLVLAELIAGNKTLQQAAEEARVTVTLGAILKKTFDPIPCSSKQRWPPRSVASRTPDHSIDVPSSTLDTPGLGSDVLHAFKTRENVLRCLAALADTEDKFRQTVIDVGAAPHVMASLVPMKEIDLDVLRKDSQINTADIGNPDSVLVAACHVTRSLSRSVSILRTSLIDHGFAQPTFELLSHSNVKVQIAATEVITNLVLELSPMRSDIINAGAIKALCDHCRSANFELRFGSIWAMKHLILNLPMQTKVQCLEELGIGWLAQTLSNDAGRSFTTSSFGMGTSNAAGEQVDILNASEEPNMDVDPEPSSSEDEDEAMADVITSMRRHQPPGSRFTSARNIRNFLQQIKNDEQDTALNTERDDVRLQEQSLDFLRNFINDVQSPAMGKMIDHLLRAFGHTRFFDLMDTKLRPKNALTSSTTPGLSFSSTSTNINTPAHTSTAINWSLYPPPEIITAAMFILIHIANGRPQHRALVIAQTNIMQHILPLFHHPSPDVRRCCAWFVNNLTWKDDSSDDAGVLDRVKQLQRLGYWEKARDLVKDDVLDVREKAKLGVDQMQRLLGAEIGVAEGTSGTSGSGSGMGPGGLRGGGGSGYTSCNNL